MYPIRCLLFGSLLFFGLVFVRCSPEKDRFRFESAGRPVPEFSADYAVDAIQKQIDFGARYPGSSAHQETRNFLVESLQSYAGKRNVYVQTFLHTGYDEVNMELYNIVASFNPESPVRVLLAAHWDTRPRSENDEDSPASPLIGADDGGSGVGVLLELARLFQNESPPIGVDIILFDGEDYGRSGDLHHFFLGSRYWSQNPPVANYNPRFGVLLDMVGGVGARFSKETYSRQFAPNLVEAVWSLAHEMGFEKTFPDREGAAVSDDHVMVNRYTDIPMINIIHHERGQDGTAQFPSWWHTQQDRMEIIDPETLQVVGDLMVELVYNRIN
ncbi:MAG: M28 family peptidase [Balneolaceae bacterium]